LLIIGAAGRNAQFISRPQMALPRRDQPPHIPR
jgi:hypothetical protein